MERQLSMFEPTDYIKGIAGAERRFFATGEIETREQDGKQVFRGYAARFNSWSNDLGGFREKIDPAFFNDVLTNDVRALFNHDPNFVLGRTQSGTLTIGVDDRGLWYEYTDPGTTWSRDLSISINRRDVTQSSFAFSIADNGDKWERVGDGIWERTLLKASALYDVSPVTYPAYNDTSVAGRSKDKVEKELIKQKEKELLADLIEREQFEMRTFFNRNLK